MNGILESNQWVGFVLSDPPPQVKDLGEGRVEIEADLLFSHPAFFDKVESEDFWDPLQEVYIGDQLYRHCVVRPGDRLFAWDGRYVAVRFRKTHLEAVTA